MTVVLKIEKPMAWAFSRRSVAGAQLALEHDEVHRLNPVPPGIHVLSGVAWIAWKGKDVVLDQGQEIRFSSGGDDPVISAVGSRELVVEMLE
jgi:hypothetical protein